MDIKEAVNNVFMIQGVDYPEMSVTDIALELVYKYEEFKNSNADELKNQVSRYLANDTKKRILFTNVLKMEEVVTKKVITNFVSLRKNASPNLQ